MSLTLSKGESFSLAKDGEALRVVRVGLGWDKNPGSQTWDLDASAFGLHNGKVPDERWFIFYKQLVSRRGAIEHMGDELEGGNGSNDDADDEEILIDLERLDDPRFGFNIDTVAIAVSIHMGEEKRQTFGQVRNAYIRVFNDETGELLKRYDLTDEASSETAVVFGEVYKSGDGWYFRATGKPFKGNLAEVCRNYGLDL
jgi:tellurium resistance protein TerD